VKEINCRENCRMTKELRESKHCTGSARLTDSGLVFGCEESLSAAPQEDKNFLTCVFWDMSLKERCLSCPLKCKNNKNEDFERKQIEIKQLDEVLSKMNNFGITAEYAHKIVDKHKKSGSMDPNALKALGLSNTMLNIGMSGKPYDISSFQYIMKDLIKKINQDK